ncbi:NACHT domain-containing protein [Bailinhaonella thermotolerans]|uniref:NACHT domain-containing protein n=2 Tax=Bailinhaonella thermotolerans TaxID=1070861 RepID=A0A3A4AKI7_9ACTN|nr:NACHT domain-containing protein [Bailinhaonella thermotolerans]
MAGLAVTVAAIAVALRLGDLTTAANIAQLISLMLAALPIAAGLMGRWRPAAARESTPEQVEQAQRTLRNLVRDQWHEEIQIRELDDARLAVRWRLTELEPAGAERGRLLRSWLGRMRFTGRTDRVDKMARHFRNLTRRRLVILGGPGMGKTTLAVLLLRELLDEARPGAPVPVLLSMAGWDPAAEPVHRWLARRLSEDYPALEAGRFGADAPYALVSQRRILPILDGLDELPAEVRPRVLAALNKAATSEDVILTCRTREYHAAVEMPGGQPLSGAAIIEPRPLTAADAASYIRSGLTPAQARAWPPVLDALAGDPGGPIGGALSTPLTLWLLRKVYIDTRADPAPLLQIDSAEGVTAHLLDNLVHAAFTSPAARHDPDDPHYHQHPFRPRYVWDPGEAVVWLSFLASHMNRMGTRDLQWWRLHRAVSRRWSTLIGSVTVGLTVGLTVGVTSGLTIALTGALPGTFADALAFGVLGGLTGGLVGGLTGGLILELREDSAMAPAYANVRLAGRVRSLLANLSFGLSIGPVVGMVAALPFWLAGGLHGGVWAPLVFGLSVGAAGGVMVGLSRWVTSPVTDAEPQTPDITLRRDLELVYIRALTFGLTLGIAFGVAGAVAEGFTPGPVPAIQAGIAFGIAGGLVFTLTFRLTGASSTYLVTLVLLYAGGRAPLRLMRFLEDAHRAGLLREAGPVFQFRHANLQDRLAETYRPPSRLPHRR